MGPRVPSSASAARACMIRSRDAAIPPTTASRVSACTNENSPSES